MKLKNLGVKTQLRLVFALIFVCVAVLGAIAWWDTNLLQLQTKRMYEYPLQTRRSIGNLEAAILGMRLELRNWLLADTVEGKQLARQNAMVAQADAEHQLDVLSRCYLGPKLDIENAKTAFVRWAAMRDEAWRQADAGDNAGALDRLDYPGDVHRLREELLGFISTIDRYSLVKGDEIFAESDRLNRTLNLQLALIMGGLLLLSAAASSALARGIRVPLGELTRVAGEFGRGRLDTRSEYSSGNEFGLLSYTVNSMAERLEGEVRLKEDAAVLAETMSLEDDARIFCRRMLQTMMRQTGAQMGAVYLLDEAGAEYRHFESIGLSSAGREAFSSPDLEGEFGQAIATKQIHIIRNGPPGGRFVLTTVGGELAPREILTIPVLSGGDVSGLVSLATVGDFPPSAFPLANSIWRVLSARLNSVLLLDKVRVLAGRLDEQNRELERQTMELESQNSLLEMQKRGLDEANRLKGVFLSNMSHELRTPLNSVIALTGVLHRRLAEMIPKEEHGHLEIIGRNARELLGLINGLLDLSRIESGRDEIRPRSFSLGTLASETAATLEPLAREKGIALSLTVEDGLPPVVSDPDKLRRILMNLVGNAVKFTDEGRVSIAVSRDGGCARITVADTGIGIGAADLPHIFDEFRQADEGLTRKHGGTGLGLAIAKKYATMLGGDITLKSAPGVGSEFTLVLPVVFTAEGHDLAAAGGVAGRILLVEDNEPSIIQIRDTLTREGHLVSVARNGVEALEQIGREPPDAVILDLMMPEMDGFELLRAIRGREQTARLPVLILTARHVTGEELSFLKFNRVHQLIQKGDVRRDELLSAVAGMLTPSTEKAPGGCPADVKGHRPVILLVEDNPDNMSAMRAILGDNYRIIEASDGGAGVDMARQHVPNLILMNMLLPVMDGGEVLAAIRKDETLKGIPIIAVTAGAMADDHEDALACGFDGHVSKPFNVELLLQTIKGALDERAQSDHSGH